MFLFSRCSCIALLRLEVLHEVLHVLLHLEVQGYKEDFVKVGLTRLKHILIYSITYSYVRE